MATATLISEASTTDIIATVQVQISYGEISYTEIAYVEMRGISVLVSAEPSELPADGNSMAIVSAQVLETTSSVAVAEADVYFATSLGSIQATATTDEAGIATVYLISPTSPGVALITATYGGIQGLTYVMFGSLNLTLEASTRRIVGDGISTVTITATLMTDDNSPIVGLPINFSTTDGVIPRSANTNNSGQAQVTFTVPDYPAQATVTASFNEAVSTSITIDIIDVKIGLAVAHQRIAADGLSSQNVVATLVSEDNNPVVSVPIDFRTSDGVITTRTSTDSLGQAKAVLVSPAHPCQATVIASFADRKADTAYVDFLPLEIDLKPQMARMVADGISTQELEVTLTTEDGTPVAGAQVDFSTTSGIVTAAAITDDEGKAFATLRSAASPSAATVRASYMDAYEAETVVDFELPHVTVKAAPATIVASSSISTMITAYVTFDNGEPVPDGTQVAFSTSEGTIATSATTTSGIVDTRLRPTGVANNDVKVTASVAGSQATTTVVFAPGDPDVLVAYATPDTIPSNGTVSSTIVAEVRDANGNYVEDGTIINFTITDGNGVVTPTGLTVGGVATARFAPVGGGGAARITASASVTASDEIAIVMSSGEAGAIVADPDTAFIVVGGTGSSCQATIVAHVYDSSTNPVEDGTQVVFTIQHGPGGGEYIDKPSYGYGPVTKSTVEGAASVTITSGTLPGTVVLKIEADSAVSTLAKVRIAAGPPDSIIVNTGDIVRSGAGGEYVLCISGLVRDAYNNPVANGTVVYWTIDRPDVGFINSESYSGCAFPCEECNGLVTKGVAHSCLVFPTSSMTKSYTIIASCGEAQSSFATSIPIVEPVEFTLEASPSFVSGSVGGEVTVWGYLEDDSNTLPITGATVAFSIEGAGSLSTYYDVTDEFGLATTTLTIPPGTSAGTTTITGRVWMTDNQATVEVTINP